jgi:hypothetical protein
MKPAKQLFITSAFAAAAACALMLIGVRSAETPNLGEMDEDGAKVCIIADDCTWGEQIPDEFAGTIEVEPGVTLKQFREDIDVLLRAIGMPVNTERNGVVIINDDPGGNPLMFWGVFQHYAHMNTKVEVRGDCMSACTLIVGAIDKSKLCFGPNGKLHFHQGRSSSDDSVSPETTQWTFDRYPSDIQNWIGKAKNLPMEGFWTLHAEDLWKTGYQKCAD